MASARLKVKFPSMDAYRAGGAIESADTTVPVASEERLFTVLEAIPDRRDDEVNRTATVLEKEYGALIAEDYQYDIDPDEVDGVTAEASLDDVVDRTNAPQVWEMGYTGKDVAIAVVDTGVDDTQLQIASKGVGGWARSWTQSLDRLEGSWFDVRLYSCWHNKVRWRVQWNSARRKRHPLSNAVL